MPSNRFAGAGSRRKQRAPAASGGHAIVTPSSILGTAYHTDFRADDPFRVMNGSQVAALYNYGLDASDALAAVLEQPTYGATAFNGGPGVTGSLALSSMLATFNTALASGSRPYMWLVIAPAALETAYAAIAKDAGFNQRLGVLLAGTVKGVRYDGSNITVTDSSLAVAGRHLIEVGFTASGTACLVVDGTAFNDTALTPAAAITRLQLFGSPVTVSTNSTLARCVVASSATAQQRIDMRAYLTGANHPNYPGSSYGL